MLILYKPVTFETRKKEPQLKKKWRLIFNFNTRHPLVMLFASIYLGVFYRTTCMSIFEENGKKKEKRKQACCIPLCTTFKLAKLISMQNIWFQETYPVLVQTVLFLINVQQTFQQKNENTTGMCKFYNWRPFVDYF